jgi:hypothetical protein
VHAASTIEGSSTFVRYGERNRLATVTTCAPRAFAWRAVVRYVLATGSYAATDVRAAWLRLRAFGSYVVLLPHLLRARARIRRRRSEPDDRVLAWQRPSASPSLGRAP